MNYSAEDYRYMSFIRIAAFETISRSLGEGHPITKMMGTLSYGRHKFEPGPDVNLRKAIAEYGFLEGYFDCLNTWARDNDSAAQRVMLRAWPRGMRKQGEAR